MEEVLKPMSLQILTYLVDHIDEPPKQSEEVALALGLNKRQVDAAITKSLVRWNFVFRQAELTELRKKLYNVIVVTDLGVKYIQEYNSNII